MRRVFLCVLALFALAFAENVTTTEPPAEISTLESKVIVSTTTVSSSTNSEVIVGTTESSPTTVDIINSTTSEISRTTLRVTEGTSTESSPTLVEVTEGTTTESSPTSVGVTEGTTTESSPTTVGVTEGNTTDSSPTKLQVINSTIESSPAVADKPSENEPSKTPSFQYFAVPFIPLNGLVHNFSGQYGVLPPAFSGIMNSVPQQTDRNLVEEPEKEPQIPPVIESSAAAALPEFLQGISSMQELTEMVFREMLNQQRGNGTCGGFIELVGQAEINHKISWGLPPADVESCSWVIWAQRGGPISVDFPVDPSAKFDDSLSSLWILDLNDTQGYQKTLMKPGDGKTFETKFRGVKGYFPFVIVHMLVKRTQPDQRLHLKFFDQAGNFSYPLNRNVLFLNETDGRRAIVHHPASKLSKYERTERFFLMGQTPKGRRVSLGIYPDGLPNDDYTWIQISWIDLDSLEVHQEKTTLGKFVRRYFRVDLKPSTSFVVVFCSYDEGGIGKGFDLTYEFY